MVRHSVGERSVRLRPELLSVPVLTSNANPTSRLGVRGRCTGFRGARPRNHSGGVVSRQSISEAGQTRRSLANYDGGRTCWAVRASWRLTRPALQIEKAVFP